MPFDFLNQNCSWFFFLLWYRGQCRQPIYRWQSWSAFPSFPQTAESRYLHHNQLTSPSIKLFYMKCTILSVITTCWSTTRHQDRNTWPFTKDYNQPATSSNPYHPFLLHTMYLYMIPTHTSRTPWLQTPEKSQRPSSTYLGLQSPPLSDETLPQILDLIKKICYKITNKFVPYLQDSRPVAYRLPNARPFAPRLACLAPCLRGSHGCPTLGNRFCIVLECMQWHYHGITRLHSALQAILSS